ncbi:MAG: N-acetylneuraminate lyase [Ruminiclostridium sp.]
MKNLKGIYAALITPFESSGEVNYIELKNIVAHLIEKGIDGFYVCGSTAEAFLLTVEERKNILEAVVEASKSRAKIIAHTGSIGTDLTVDLALHAKKSGADAISAVTPFYYKFSAEEIVNYYYEIADRTQMPTIIYNFPNLTGFALSVKNVDDLANNKNIVGIKYTASDLYTLERFKFLHPDMLIYNGFDEVFLYGLMAGADGGIGSTYNFMPKKYRTLMDLFYAGKYDEARMLQHEINDLIDVVAKYGAMATTKEFLTLEGFDCGICRSPFKPLSTEAKAEIKKAFDEKLK